MLLIVKVRDFHFWDSLSVFRPSSEFSSLCSSFGTTYCSLPASSVGSWSAPLSFEAALGFDSACPLSLDAARLASSCPLSFDAARGLASSYLSGFFASSSLSDTSFMSPMSIVSMSMPAFVSLIIRSFASCWSFADTAAPPAASTFACLISNFFFRLYIFMAYCRSTANSSPSLKTGSR